MDENEQARVQRISEGLLAKRGWQLVTTHAEFLRAVEEDLATRFPDTSAPLEEKQIERAAMRQYCAVLYDACGQAGSARQRRAFQELWEYLYRAALYKVHERRAAEDLVQRALVDIWRKHSDCQDRHAFLYWCSQVLLTTFLQTLRKQAGDETEEMDESVLENAAHQNFGAGAIGLTRSGGDEEMVEQVAQAEQRAQLIAAIRVCLDNLQQVAVIIELFLNDKSYKQVADEMGIKVNYVYQLKRRAVLELGTCDEFTRVYEQWLS